MARPQHIEDVLVTLHDGQWFSWSGSKVYENLVMLTDEETPTNSELETELSTMQSEWDAEQAAHSEDTSSAKVKLVELGLSENEISAAFGI